jgi:coniferyl-aldehyde dehydrogenase
MRHASKHLRRWMRPQRRAMSTAATFGLMRNRVIPQPLGVVGVIVPWNFPLNLSLVPLTYIFAAGNRAMVKMSENSRHLARLLIDKMPAYFPPEKLQFFDETGGVGIAFSKLPFDHLLFTGSGATGRAGDGRRRAEPLPGDAGTGRQGAGGGLRGLPRCAGGRAHPVRQVPQRRPDLHHGRPCLRARGAGIRPSCGGPAPSCRALPGLDSPDYTSIIEPRAFERLRPPWTRHAARCAMVIPLLPGPAFDEARQDRAAHRAERPADCELMQREIFGPILPLRAATASLDEVVARINAGPRPLALYPFSHDARACRCCWSG